MGDLRYVIVTPGRVAFTSPKANKRFTDAPTQVSWNSYLQELLEVHGDIQVVDPVAYFAAKNPKKTVKTVAPAPAPVVEDKPAAPAVKEAPAKAVVEAPLRIDDAPKPRAPSQQ